MSNLSTDRDFFGGNVGEVVREATFELAVG